MNHRKVGVVGCGFVGAASAFAIMESGLFSEMVLIDANKEKAEGEALDISHGLPFAKPMQIYAGDYEDIADAAIVVVTAGAGQKPGETRLDNVKKNVGIFKSIIPQIAEKNKDGILLIVANPVDILTLAALKLSGYPEFLKRPVHLPVTSHAAVRRSAAGLRQVRRNRASASATSAGSPSNPSAWRS